MLIHFIYFKNAKPQDVKNTNCLVSLIISLLVWKELKFSTGYQILLLIENQPNQASHKQGGYSTEPKTRV